MIMHLATIFRVKYLFYFSFRLLSIVPDLGRHFFSKDTYAQRFNSRNRRWQSDNSFNILMMVSALKGDAAA